MDKLDRIERKIDMISDRMNKLEVDVAKQEGKILKRILSTIVLVVSLVYTSIKLYTKS